jgi:phosphoglycolate phosphatase
VRYRLVIFDFDGTLADSFPSFVRIVNAAAARYRFRPIAAAEVDVLRGYGTRALLRHLQLAPWKLPLVARYHRRALARELNTVTLFPGVAAAVDALAGAGVRLALVTSNGEANVRRVLGPALLARFAHREYGASLLGKARRFRRVLRASGVAPGDALAVGDDLRDLDAARAAGLAFGAVSWGYARADALAAAAPTVLFGTAADIVPAVLGSAARVPLVAPGGGDTAAGHGAAGHA